MARRRRRSNGRFAGFNVGGVLSKVGIKNASINSQDAAMGAAVGVAAALAARYLENTVTQFAKLKGAPGPSNGVWSSTATISDKALYFAHNNLPGLASIAAAAALYFVGKKSSKAYGHAVGAALVGAGLVGIGLAQSVNPSFRGLVRVNLGGLNYGFLAKDADRQALSGLIVRDSQAAGQFAGFQGMPQQDALAGLRGFAGRRARMMA